MKKYLVILLLCLFTMVGCKEFLNQKPKLAQSDDISLSNLRNLNLAMMGAYGNLISPSWYGSDFILRYEMASPDGKKYIGTKYDSGRLNDWYHINYSINDSPFIWRSGYVAIYKVNSILENLEGKGTKEELNNLRAECLFIRAIANFDMVRVFARPYNYTPDASHLGIPIILKTDPSYSDRPARSTVKQVYEQIIKDLTEAENIISPDFQRQDVTDPKATVTKPVIQALLSRVYLYQGNWQKAADYATMVINSGKYTMWNPNDLKDAACYTQDVPKGGEIIFEAYNATNNSSYDPRSYICNFTSPKEYPDGGASKDLYDIYENQDIRKQLFVEQEGVLWTAKYKGKGVQIPDVNNVIILRLSEMYLNRAEAGIHGATGVDVVGDLNMIASHRNATPQAPNLEGVYLERWKELAWEGHLWFDLARTKRPMVRNDYIGPESGKRLEVNDYRWVSSFSTNALTLNKNIEQNPGYLDPRKK